jgi:hypothetical protein
MHPTLRRWGGRTLLAAVTLLLIAWLGGWIRFTTDPRLAEVIAMQREADRSVAIDGGPKTEAEARVIADTWEKIKEKTDALPPTLRGQAAAAGWATAEAGKRRAMDRFFATPPADRKAELDRQIKSENLLREAFAATAAARPAAAVPAPAAGQPGGAAGSSGARPQAQTQSEDSRNAGRKAVIDNTSSSQRARFFEYQRALNERRKATAGR